MGELAAALGALVLLCSLVGGVAAFAGRSRARRTRRALLSARAAVWEVVEQGALNRTRVFVRKVTADGDEVDRIPVAEIPDGASDWEAQLLEARAQAANRAAALNLRP